MNTKEPREETAVKLILLGAIQFRSRILVWHQAHSNQVGIGINYTNQQIYIFLRRVNINRVKNISFHSLILRLKRF